MILDSLVAKATLDSQEVQDLLLTFNRFQTTANVTTTDVTLANVTFGSGTGGTISGVALLEVDDITSGDIVPSANNTYSLGSATNVWADIFVGPASLHVAGQNALGGQSGNIVLQSTTGDLVMQSLIGDIYLNSNVVLTDNSFINGAGTFELGLGNIFIGSLSGVSEESNLDDEVGALNYLKNLIEDTSPELGGDLNASSRNITGINSMTIDTSGTGISYTNIGSINKDGSNNFRVSSENNLILASGASATTAVNL